eukprot:m.244983 g.244983  ORF g.244983 m.244983 type:complete len:557 (+) comp34405_c0_seq1:133-1803(+)
MSNVSLRCCELEWLRTLGRNLPRSWSAHSGSPRCSGPPGIAGKVLATYNPTPICRFSCGADAGLPTTPVTSTTSTTPTTTTRTSTSTTMTRTSITFSLPNISSTTSRPIVTPPITTTVNSSIVNATTTRPGFPTTTTTRTTPRTNSSNITSTTTVRPTSNASLSTSPTTVNATTRTTVPSTTTTRLTTQATSTTTSTRATTSSSSSTPVPVTSTPPSTTSPATTLTQSQSLSAATTPTASPVSVTPAGAGARFAYMIGGTFNESGVTPVPESTLYKYDSTTNTFTTLAPAPLARANPGAAVLNGYLYVMGGTGPGAAGTTHRYHIATNTWSVSMGLLNYPRSHIFALTIAPYIYALGGYDTNLQTSANFFERFSPTTNTWQPLAPLPPTALAYGSAATVVGGEIYLSGGNVDLILVNSLFKYTPSTGTWTQLPSMMNGRFNHAAVALGSRMLVIGGEWEAFFDVDAFETSSTSWLSSGTFASLPHSFDGVTEMQACALQGKIYIWGGRTQSNIIHKNGLLFDPSVNTWTSNSSAIAPTPGPAASKLRAFALTTSDS